MNSTTDYSGRQVDMELLQTISQPTGTRRLSISIAQPIARIVTVIQKAVQRYATLFLSMKDSQFDSSLGTDFMAQVQQGWLGTREKVSTAFAFANADVMEIMQKDDRDATYGDQPADEQVVQADLLDYQVDYASARLSLTIQLTTAAGDAVTFVLPTSAPRE